MHGVFYSLYFFADEPLQVEAESIQNENESFQKCCK